MKGPYKEANIQVGAQMLWLSDWGLGSWDVLSLSFRIIKLSQFF